MSAFSEANVAAAIQRIPLMSSKDLRDLRERASGQNIQPLVDACDLALEGRPIEYSQDDARRFEAQALEVVGMDLTSCIRHAFTKTLPPSPDEVRILRWLAANPGGAYKDAVRDLGNDGLSLWIGHLVYDRFGCFRGLMRSGEDQSSLLLEKDRSGESVRYRLRPETETVFRELGII
jgi:hypothetical protein